MSDSWLGFWSRPHPAFGAGERTRDEHESIARATIEVLGLSAGSRLLDFGCGYALGAEVYLAAGVQLLLHDVSPHFEAEARRRYEGRAAIRVLSADDLAELDDGSVDAVVAFSVVQYLSSVELTSLLGLAARVTKPGGALLLADIIPPETRLFDDLLDFLPRTRTVRRVLGRLKDAALLAVGSDYGSLRRRIGLRRYDDTEMAGLLCEAGLDPIRLGANVGPNRSRRAWLARRSDH